MERISVDSIVTGDQVKQAMVEQNISYSVSHSCAICGLDVGYTRDGEDLFFNPSCGCGWAPRQPRTWEDAAWFINAQSSAEVKATFMRRFGLLPGDDDNTEFSRYYNMARERRWGTPINGVLPDEAWVHYWKAMEKYETEGGGRPVPPHRSGGGYAESNTELRDALRVIDHIAKDV